MEGKVKVNHNKPSEAKPETKKEAPKQEKKQEKKEYPVYPRIHLWTT